MKQVRMSLMDNDYVIQAKTDFGIDGGQNREVVKFLNRLKEELVIGETEFLTIEGLHGETVNFRISATD